MDQGDDGLLAQALAQLEEAKRHVRDLEGFVRIYTEFRKRGPGGALPAVVADVSSAAPSADLIQQAQPEPVRQTGGMTLPMLMESSRSRPAMILSDPDLSISEAAAKVLRHFGEPMKARRIAETLLSWQYPYSKGVDDLRASVGGVLARAVREGDTFTTVNRGVFGLVEWGVETTGGDEPDEAPDIHEFRLEDGPEA